MVHVNRELQQAHIEWIIWHIYCGFDRGHVFSRSAFVISCIINICSISNSLLIIDRLDNRLPANTSVQIHFPFFRPVAAAQPHGATPWNGDNEWTKVKKNNTTTEQWALKRQSNWNRLNTWTTREKKFASRECETDWNIHHINVKTATRSHRNDDL